MKSQISICIPTYNFGQFIGDTLDSITSQFGFDNSIEIVVLDGGSTDNTQQVIESKKIENLKYIKMGEKGGIDLDIIKTISNASGNYCWLFSSDDIMAPGALWKVMRKIEKDQELDLIVGTHTNCNLDMEFINIHPVLKAPNEVRLNFSINKDRINLLNIAQTSETLFSFISTLVIKREKWNSVKTNSTFIGSCWAHVARILEIQKLESLVINYSPELLVYKRGENDSFLDNDLLGRLGISILGFEKISKYYYGKKSQEYKLISQIISNEISLTFFIFAFYTAKETTNSTRTAFALKLAFINFKSKPLKFIISASIILIGHRFINKKSMTYIYKCISYFLIHIIRGGRK